MDHLIHLQPGLSAARVMMMDEVKTVSDKNRGAADPKTDTPKSDTQKSASRKEPIVIKKYANRRLYNTDTSTYVTLEDLAQMVRAERDFMVYDAKNGDDLTHTVLTQIIVEQEGRGASLLPVPFLRQLIRFYGDSMSAFVPSYLQMSMENLTRDQEQYRKQFAHLFTGKTFPPVPFGTAGFEAMQTQIRQNMAVFERTLGMFTPFQAGQAGTPANGTGGHAAAASSSADGTAARKDNEAAAASSSLSPSELAELKAQMQAMQAKLEKMTSGKE